MDTPPERAKLQEVLETIPNSKWTAIGKCLLENDMLDQQVVLKRWDSEPRGDVFLDVLRNLADDHSRATVSWKQLMNILQMQLGYSHEAISLVMEVVGQYSLGKHGYGSTTVQCEDSHSRSRGITDSLMDPTTPLLLQGHKGNSPKWRKVFYCLSRPLMIAFILLIVLLIVGLVVFVVQSKPTSTTKQGYSGDTILVDTMNTFWSTKLTAFECRQFGDGYHIISLYLVPSDALVTYEYDRVIRSRVFQQPSPSFKTGMINTDMYLLKGSSIDYDICVTNEDTHGKEGELYVFDNEDNFDAYVSQASDGKQLSVHYQPLQIGGKNVTACTRLHYMVDHPSYYFVSAWGPSNIVYSYNTTIHTVAFNHSQYDEVCRMMGTFPCDSEIPNRLFEIKSFTLLAYIHPLSATDPLTTHICLSTQRSTTVIFVVSAFASLIVILLVLLVVVLFICICTRSKKRKHGYMYIQ